VGPEFQVNSTTTGTQYRPVVACDGGGNFVVIWNSYGQDGDRGGIFGQIFDGSGLPLGGEFQVNTYTLGDQDYPRVAMQPSGEFVVIWQDGDDVYNGHDGSAGGVFGRRFSDVGAPLGDQFPINTTTSGHQRLPDVGVDSMGRFTVVWESYGQDGSGSGSFGRRFDASGNPLGGEFQLNTYTTTYQEAPRIAMNASGAFVVVWDSHEQDGDGHGIFGQRFDSSGLPQGAEFQVHTTTAQDQNGAAVGIDSRGNFVVVWEGRHDGSARGVFGQRFDSMGARRGAEFQVNSFTEEFQWDPSLLMDPQGNFVVAWTSGNDDDPNAVQQDGSAYGVFGQWFTRGGIPQGGEFQINTFTLGDQTSPSIAPAGSGRFVVVWESGPRFGFSPDPQDGSGDGVFAQRFSAPACPAAAALQGASQEDDALRVVREFREGVMAASPEGRAYIDRYYRYAPEVVVLLLRHPDLRARVRDALIQALPALRSAAQGEVARVNPARIAEVDALLEQLGSKAGRSLREALASLRTDLRNGALFAMAGIEATAK